MASDLPLSPRTLSYLRDLPPHSRSLDLLTGIAADGPLHGNSAYSAETATAAHFLWIAWTMGWTSGILSGRKGYEARELLGHRVRAARTKARDLRTWGLAVLSGLGVRSDALTGTSALWWREVCAASEAAESARLPGAPSLWRELRSERGTADALEAVGFLIDWQAQAREYARAEQVRAGQSPDAQ